MKIDKLWKLFFWGGQAFVFGNMAFTNMLNGSILLGLLYTLLMTIALFFILKGRVYDSILKKKKSPILIETILNLIWFFILIWWLLFYGKFEQVNWAIGFYYWSVSVLYFGIVFAILSFIFLISRLSRSRKVG